MENTNNTYRNSKEEPEVSPVSPGSPVASIEKFDDARSAEATVYIDENKMFRKVDTRVLIVMLITYSLQFMDKLALSAGAVYGLKKDLHLVGQDYSWTSSIFYFGYLGGNFLTVRLLQILPIGKFVSGCVCLWAITLACTAATTSYGGLLAARFFLGLLESTVSPTFVLMTSMWWKRSQQPSRAGIWFAGNDVGGIVSSFIAFGLVHIKGHIHPWKYIFIVYGCMTFLWSLIMIWFLPDSPEKANFLTAEEKQFYREKLTQSKVEHEWDWAQFRSCLTDINLFMLLGTTVLCILPNSGVLSYGFIILDSFGFPPIDVTLLNLPGSVLAWIAITFTGVLATRFKNIRCVLMVVICIFSIIGGCLIYKGESRGVKLTGFYFISVQPAVFPLVLSLAASNFRGTTRRAVVNSSIFIVYCACNIGGPQLFRHQDAPTYSYAFRSWIICYCLNIGMAGLIAFKLAWDNKKQAAKDQTVPAEGLYPETLDPTFRYLY